MQQETNRTIAASAGALKQTAELLRGRSRGAAHLHQWLSVSPVPTPGSMKLQYFGHLM